MEPKVGEVYEDAKGYQYTILKRHMPESEFHQGFIVSRDPPYRKSYNRRNESLLMPSKFTGFKKVTQAELNARDEGGPHGYAN